MFYYQIQLKYGIIFDYFKFNSYIYLQFQISNNTNKNQFISPKNSKFFGNYQPEIINIRKLLKEKDQKTPHKQSKMFQKQFY